MAKVSECQAPDTEELVACALRGDEQAWRTLLGRYSRRVFAMARSRLRRDDAAEEITQSVFVTVAEKFGSGTYDEQGSFESWLFRITMNRVRDEVRRLRRHARPTDPAVVAAVAEQAPGADEASGPDEGEVEALRTALDQLSDADRTIIELRHHASLSFKRIASILDEPMGTLLARHHRALRKLKQHIESGRDAHPDEESRDD